MRLFNRTPLPGGTMLVCENGERYTICGCPIGAGGSSLVYSVRQEGEYSRLAVKELYPWGPRQEAQGFLRRNGVVCGASPVWQRHLEELAERMVREKEFSQKIYNHTICVVKMLRQLRVRQLILPNGVRGGGGGYFFLMDDISQKSISLTALLEEAAQPPQEGRPLRTGGLPAVHVTAQILSAILHTLTRFHNDGGPGGWIHGDIQENNIFFQNGSLESGGIGIACMLDLGCMQPLEADKRTVPLPVRELFSTPGYVPPELLFGADTVRLGPQADLYALGRLMLYLLGGKRYVDEREDRIYYDPSLRRLLPSQAREICCGEEARALVNGILARALEFEPEYRYASAKEMKADIDRLCALTAPPKYTLLPNLPDLATFVGRERELERLETLLRQGANPIWIYGFGGMGKTELSIQFGLRQRKRGRKVYRIPFCESLEKTVASLRFEGDDAKPLMDTAERFLHHLSILSGEFRDCILILDNVEEDAGGLEGLLASPAYQDLIRRPFTVVITTRYDLRAAGLSAVEADALTDEELLEIMRRFYPAGAETELLPLLRYVQSHTLTVELLARTLQANQDALTPRTLLERLQSGRLKDAALSDVPSSQNRQYRQDTIYGHIRRLFGVSALPAHAKLALVHTVFLPPEGMDRSLYRRCEAPEQWRSMTKILLPRGWVFCDGGQLTLHPIIRELCFRELGKFLGPESFREFLMNLEDCCEQNQGGDYLHFRAVADYLSQACGILRDARAARYAGEAYIYYGMLDKAVEVLTRGLPLAADSREDPRTYAAILQNLGYAYTLCEKKEPALSYAAMAVARRKRLLRGLILRKRPQDEEDLATAYNGLAFACQLAGQFQKALSYDKKALSIRRRFAASQPGSLASAYGNLASVYEAMEAYAPGLENAREAIRIAEEVFPEGHPEMVTYYLCAGCCCIQLGKYEPAGRYLSRALEISVRLLPANHYYFVYCYQRLAWLSYAREDRDSAVFLLEKACDLSMQSGSKALLKRCGEFLRAVQEDQ